MWPPKLALCRIETVRFTVGLLHVGRPSCGMNAAVWAAVRKFSYHGYKVIGIRYGIEGFVKGDRAGMCRQLQEMGWSSVSGWVTKGGANLGISSTVACSSHDEIIALRLRENKMQALLFIGGFEVGSTFFRWLCVKVVCWGMKELLAKSPRSVMSEGGVLG
ncbi:unnamed protein product [Timema podura]|uniref:Phosphofructokinase domain-containing protein n=1 Tax=Timema podura TaxID=61482 RepID=A0ABN7P1X8_TIMPD|nr:unnamed protein product [Timema podura]